MESKVNLVVGDALETISVFDNEHPESLCSFAYLDFDLYEPTKAALKLVEKHRVSAVLLYLMKPACPSGPVKP